MIKCEDERRGAIGVDWDGTLFPKECWTRHDECKGELFTGAAEFLRALDKDYDVIIFSARCTQEAGRLAIIDCLKRNRLMGIVRGVTNKKSYNFVKIIDDRAMYCDGNNSYKEILEELGL